MIPERRISGRPAPAEEMMTMTAVTVPLNSATSHHRVR